MRYILLVYSYLDITFKNLVEKMANFIPAPKYSEEWWKSIPIYNIIGFDQEMCSETAEPQPGNWLAFAVYNSEFCAPAMGYRVLFPTSTDCLYWIRWLVLPESCDYDDDQPRAGIVLSGKAEELAGLIDGSPEGTHAEDLLRSIRDNVRDWITDDHKTIFLICSLEEYEEMLQDD